MLAFPPPPKPAALLPALVMPKLEVDLEGDDDKEEEDPEEDPIDIKGDDVDHEDGVNEAKIGQIKNADVEEHLDVELRKDTNNDGDASL